LNANWVHKELGLTIVLILALAALGCLFYLGSEGWRDGADARQIAVEGLLFVFVFIWNLAILPRWRSARTLCLGSLLFLLGSFADVADNFFHQPRWGDWLVEDLSLALGAGLMALGIRSWVREKDRLLAQFQRERDFEASLIPKLFHDLRVPLGNMIGMTDIAQGDPKFLEDSGRRREYFDVVMRAANDMYFLIDNVLETYRIKSETLRLSPTATSLTALLDESLKDFHYQARKKQIGLTTDFPETDIELTADRVKIVRVIQNLLANAIKFSPRGGKIILKAGAQDGRITIRVVDEGPGVPQELLAPLFDEGTAASRRESEEAEGEGFGLGLKVVREFVRLHGGRFWIEPNTPHGAQFCFSLPQAQPRSP
jgi:signal transduction histidine kinase